MGQPKSKPEESSDVAETVTHVKSKVDYPYSQNSKYAYKTNTFLQHREKFKKELRSVFGDENAIIAKVKERCSAYREDEGRKQMGELPGYRAHDITVQEIFRKKYKPFRNIGYLVSVTNDDPSVVSGYCTATLLSLDGINHNKPHQIPVLTAAHCIHEELYLNGEIINIKKRNNANSIHFCAIYSQGKYYPDWSNLNFEDIADCPAVEHYFYLRGWESAQNKVISLLDTNAKKKWYNCEKIENQEDCKQLFDSAWPEDDDAAYDRYVEAENARSQYDIAVLLLKTSSDEEQLNIKKFCHDNLCKVNGLNWQFLNRQQIAQLRSYPISNKDMHVTGFKSDTLHAKILKIYQDIENHYIDTNDELFKPNALYFKGWSIFWKGVAKLETVGYGKRGGELHRNVVQLDYLDEVYLDQGRHDPTCMAAISMLRESFNGLLSQNWDSAGPDHPLRAFPIPSYGGDSGGPLIARIGEKEIPVVIGVVSTGYDLDDKGLTFTSNVVINEDVALFITTIAAPCQGTKCVANRLWVYERHFGTHTDFSIVHFDEIADWDPNKYQYGSEDPKSFGGWKDKGDIGIGKMRPKIPPFFENIYHAKQEMTDNILDGDNIGYTYNYADNYMIYLAESVISIIMILCCTGLCCLFLSILMGLSGGYVLNKTLLKSSRQSRGGYSDEEYSQNEPV